ncbi:putative acylesterase/phospholipase RssA [Catalinimonas alkaloidigena]|uniref:patatin-like phospholipase family protein n=1 Tax=Catalinimonas alkaloidigena TaxID=1075417 RepID=UPI0024072416|nr:patatin-like phospholipase family protein [Catalinimonas alkaloidigena]MDF9798624.1 putative acylesterase/phospholipase RssA [Catalinimonas alkaloidigena]
MSLPKLIQLHQDNTQPKRSLILAGGGVRLAYQAGVLQALQENSLRFQHVDGTSGGIFNAGMLASGLETEEMCKRWRSLNISSFMSLRPARNYLKLASMAAFGDADGIRQKVFPQLGIDLKKIRENKEVCATFNVCNFSHKTIEAIPHSNVTEDHLIAGVSLPIFMPAIKINDDWYSDAVWIKDANLMEAVRKGAEEIWLVWAIGNTKEYLPGFFNQYVHMIEMSANGGLLEEYAQIKALNERIAAGDSPYGQRKPIRLHVIKPEYPLPLDPDLFFNKIDTNTLINMGYVDALNYLKRMKTEGVAFDANSTRMKEPGRQFTFRQSYEGKTKFGGKISAMAYHPSFTVREINGQLSISAVASVYIEALGREICTKENQANIIKKDKASYLEIDSTFVHEAQKYVLKASIQLHSVTNWLLGLEFKKVKLQLFDDQQENLCEGHLRQTAGNRLKQLLNNKLTSNGQGGIRLKEKYQMVKKLYA